MNDRPTPETERVKGALHTNWDDLLNHARRLERERDRAREDATNYYAKIGELEQERDKAREALQRIADCDFVITLPDRMDAVRKIANDALKNKN